MKPRVGCLFKDADIKASLCKDDCSSGACRSTADDDDIMFGTHGVYILGPYVSLRFKLCKSSAPMFDSDSCGGTGDIDACQRAARRLRHTGQGACKVDKGCH